MKEASKLFMMVSLPELIVNQSVVLLYTDSNSEQVRLIPASHESSIAAGPVPLQAEIQSQIVFLRHQQQMQQQVLLQQYHLHQQDLIDRHNGQIQEHMRLYFEHQKRLQEQEETDQEKDEQKRLTALRREEKHENSEHDQASCSVFLDNGLFPSNRRYRINGGQTATS